MRPLLLGDIFNGAFDYIRRNPKATLGLALIVMAAASILPAIGYGGLSSDLARFEGELEAQGPDAIDSGAIPFSVFSLASLVGGGLLNVVADIVLSGLLTAIVGMAVLGSRLTIGQAWRMTRGRLPAVFGVAGLVFLLSLLWMALLALVITGGAVLTAAVPPLGVLVILFGIVGTIVLGVWVYVKLALAIPTTVLEGLGPLRALGRSWTLVTRRWWRVFGILLLANLIVMLVAQVLTLPFSGASMLLAGTGGAQETWMAVLEAAATYVGMVLSATVTGPFLAGVTVLLYVDTRIRREGLDLRLQTATRANEDLGINVYATVSPPTGTVGGA